MNLHITRDTLCSASAHWRFISICLLVLLLLVPVRATTVQPPDFPQLVNESDYVVRAVVKSVASEWRGVKGNGAIFTRVELEVREVIAGTPPQPLILDMLGGKVGEDEMRIQGAPRFKVGQEDILFIKGNGQNISPLFALMHGRYPIRKEHGSGREYMTRSDDVPLEDTADVALPITEGPAADMQRRMKNPSRALTPFEMTLRIRSALDPHYIRKQSK